MILVEHELFTSWFTYITNSSLPGCGNLGGAGRNTSSKPLVTFRVDPTGRPFS